MNDEIYLNLSAALQSAWQKYERLPDEPDAELDKRVVEELSHVVDRHLEAHRNAFIPRSPEVRSLLIQRLEETLFGRDLRAQPTHFLLFPGPDREGLEFVRHKGRAFRWQLQHRIQRVSGELLEGEAEVAPAGTVFERGELGPQRAMTSCQFSVPADALAHRIHRIPLVLMSQYGWEEKRCTPEIAQARADDVEIPLPEVFGSARGQWHYPRPPLRVSWWTEPEGVTRDGGALGPRGPEGDLSEVEQGRILWRDVGQGRARVVLNRVSLELDLDALLAAASLRSVHTLSFQVRFPTELAVSGAFCDHFRFVLDPDAPRLEERYAQLLGPRFSEYANPGSWQVEADGKALRAEDSAISEPAHPPAHQASIPTELLDVPVHRRNLLRSSLKAHGSIVTSEDLADAVEHLLPEAQVDRTRIRGAPTWLEPDLGFRRADPLLADFVGFVWVVPLTRSDLSPALEGRIEAVASLLNRRVPMGCRVVFETQGEAS